MATSGKSSALGIGGGRETAGKGPSVGFRPPPPMLVKGENELLYRLSREARSPEITGRLGSSAADDGGGVVFAWPPPPAPIGGGRAAAALGIIALGRLLAPRFAAACCCTMVGGAGAVVPKGLIELAYRLSMEATSPEMTGRIPSSAAAPAPLRSAAAGGRGAVDDVAAAISPNIRRARDDWAGPSGPGAVEPYGLMELVYRASRAVLSPDMTGFGAAA